MMKKIIFGIICAATLVSLIAWRIDWQKNEVEIESIKHLHSWVNYLNEYETDSVTTYCYPDITVTLTGVKAHYEIYIANIKGNETITYDAEYNWLNDCTYDRMHRA